MDSSWCLSSSLVARSPSLVIASKRADSANFSAPLMKCQARSGVLSRILRMSGTASSSPDCAFCTSGLSFSIEACLSSSSAWLTNTPSSCSGWPTDSAKLDLFLSRLLTALPPFSSVVLVVSGGEQGGAGDHLCGIAQLLHPSRESVQTLALFLPAYRLRFPSPALLGVYPCREFPEHAA